MFYRNISLRLENCSPVLAELSFVIYKYTGTVLESVNKSSNFMRHSYIVHLKPISFSYVLLALKYNNIAVYFILISFWTKDS